MICPMLSVMLIDDEEIDQRAYQRVLKRSNLVSQVVAFSYAEDALEYLRQADAPPIDVILLDINMPRMNGFEFLEAALAEFQEGFAQMVVVMLTTSLNPKDQQRAAQNPVVYEFFKKPLTVDHIGQIAKMLRER